MKHNSKQEAASDLSLKELPRAIVRRALDKRLAKQQNLENDFERKRGEIVGLLEGHGNIAELPVLNSNSAALHAIGSLVTYYV